MEQVLNSVEAGAYSSAVPPATGSNKLNTGSNERIISVLAGLALAVFAFKNLKTTGGKVLGLAGLMLLKRGVTGYCEINNLIGRNTANKKSAAMEVKVIMTINKPRNEVFGFWRNFENLPAFMSHLHAVEVLDERRSSWSANLPGGVGHVSWEAVIEQEQENELISWSSLPGSTIDNAGEIRFSDSRWPGETEVCAKISYRLPGGDAGSVAGKLFNPFVEKMIRNDLKSFKSLMETGEIPIGSTLAIKKRTQYSK
jgi:uncharacterized membrane protein